MISQAIPQALMSFFTIIVTFISMLVLSPLLTLLAIVVIGILVFVTKKNRVETVENTLCASRFPLPT